MLNKVMLIGNLTRDIELRYSPSGTAIAKTGLAVNRRFKGQNGEQKDETMFIDVTIFGKAAEVANQYLGKGRKVLAEGRLVLEQWTDQEGKNRSKHSVAVENIQFLDSKDQGSQSTNNSSGDDFGAPAASYSQPAPVRQTPPAIDIADDDIPF
jgi:single-strand DNA-binding protein